MAAAELRQVCAAAVLVLTITLPGAVPPAAAQVQPGAGAAADTLPIVERRPRGSLVHTPRIHARYPQVSAVRFRYGTCSGVDLLAVDTTGLEELRRILEAYAAEQRRQPCDDPLVRLRLFALTKTDIDAASARLRRLLAETEPRSWVSFDGDVGVLLVRTRNQPSASRARALIARDTTLPLEHIRVEGATVRAEADEPRPPPMEAYLTVLRYLRRGWDAAEPAVLVRNHLPAGLGEAEAASLQMVLVESFCPVPSRFVSFDQWRQLETGEWILGVHSLLHPDFANSIQFDVECEDGECFIVRIHPNLGDRFIACPGWSR